MKDICTCTTRTVAAAFVVGAGLLLASATALAQNTGSQAPVGKPTARQANPTDSVGRSAQNSRGASKITQEMKDAAAARAKQASDGGIAGAPATNLCANATAVGEGTFTFNTTGATTDGPAHALCLFFSNNQVSQDIWRNYTASGTGTVTVSLCGSSYDTKVAVYNGCACPVGDGNILACNDDFCGLQSTLTFSATGGNCYKVRIGGFAAAAGAGTASITLGGGGGGCGAGDCCVAHANPGCNDQECCDIVCAVDAFCCATQWDSICAGEAVNLCPICGGGGGGCGAGDCCVAHANPGCDDQPCCDAVCAIDSFCCTTQWDSICAGEAAQLCEVCGATGEPPVNNLCADRIPISDGTTAFSTVQATTDGPAHPAQCLFFGDDQISQDIWYNYTATQTGNLRVETCGSGYDTELAIYNGCSCPVSDGNLLACNDDFCGLQSRVTAAVVQGQCYKIRVGGFAAAQGTGTLTLSYATPCIDDCPSGAINIDDPCGITPESNGGCNFTPATYGDIPFPATVCGSASNTGTTRDLDWYHFTVPAGPAQVVVASVVASFNGNNPIVFLAGAGCPASVISSGTSECTAVAAAVLAPGTYTVIVSTALFSGTPCGDDNYVLTIGPCGSGGGCYADINNDGQRNFDDILEVIFNYGACP